MKMPFMYVRHTNNATDDGLYAIYVVKLALCFDLKTYNCGWMEDEVLGDGTDYSVSIPDLDLCEERWVFDSIDSVQNELDAMRKMQELWAALEIPKL
jgi:hypothetical protein